MDWNSIIQMNVIGFPEAALRAFLAMAFGLVLGLDRDSKNKPIDFRAYMIVALTTCIAAMLSQELYHSYQSSGNVVSLDLAKIISGTLTGLGFLGAGAIIKVEGKNVVGTATGASVWASGIIGLTIGFGLYALALLTLVCITAVLVLGGYFMNEKKENKSK